MDLRMNSEIIKAYTSHAQMARVVTESWMKDNMFCPRCGRFHIEHFKNNKPVADFYCPICGSQYELKSIRGHFGRKVSDGAYETMIERITSNQNPDFFFMCYSPELFSVTDLLLVPKYFFTPEVIEKRNPLTSSARRAGWIGCSINISEIPKQGRITIVKNGVNYSADQVVEQVKHSAGLETEDIKARGWLFDILQCVNSLPEEFSLSEVYAFEQSLYLKHPQNNNVKPKIRQQLQILRDKGFIEFSGSGIYKKI